MVLLQEGGPNTVEPHRLSGWNRNHHHLHSLYENVHVTPNGLTSMTLCVAVGDADARTYGCVRVRRKHYGWKHLWTWLVM